MALLTDFTCTPMFSYHYCSTDSALPEVETFLPIILHGLKYIVSMQLTNVISTEKM